MALKDAALASTALAYVSFDLLRSYSILKRPYKGVYLGLFSAIVGLYVFELGLAITGVIRPLKGLKRSLGSCLSQTPT